GLGGVPVPVPVAVAVFAATEEPPIRNAATPPALVEPVVPPRAQEVGGDPDEDDGHGAEVEKGAARIDVAEEVRIHVEPPFANSRLRLLSGARGVSFATLRHQQVASISCSAASSASSAVSSHWILTV